MSRPCQSWVRVLQWALAAGAVAAAGVFLGVSLVPLPEALSQPVPGTQTILDIHGEVLAELPSPTARRQLPVGLEQMGPWLPTVTVALEDRRFREHAGLDVRSLLGSAWRNLRRGRIISGGSTITQQLIKEASSRRRRSWWAKGYEGLAAARLERHWSKDRILAEYLNRVSYGNRLLGPEAAARTYFGKPARELTLPEAIYLAGLPQAPSRFNPWTHPEQAAARYQRALRTLRQQGFAESEPWARWQGAELSPGRHLPPVRAAHFVNSLLPPPGASRGVVRTTLDLPLQQRAEELVRAHLRLLHRHDVTCAAAVILENRTGAIRAMVGSPDFAREEMNEATAPHSAGSTLKPFLYARALENRVLTAASVLPDTREAIRAAYEDYDPQDYTRRSLGPVRVREALACSLNVPAVVALQRTGARVVFADLRRWGFRLRGGLDDYGAGFILGNAEVRPLDLAAAYAGLARGGVSVAPAYLAGAGGSGERILTPETAAIITDILCDNEARRRGFGTHSPLALERRVAVKTGTSSGFRDAWTAGFTREHTVVVWVGNADGRPMREALSTRAAAPLWAALVDDLLREDHAVDSLRPGERLVLAAVPRLPGGALLPEWFLAGTEGTPDEVQFTAAEGNAPRLRLSAEYARWVASGANTIGAFCPAAETLAIREPTAGARYVVDDDLPLRQQRLRMVSTSTEDEAVRWYLNGTELPGPRPVWPLTRGTWEVRAEREGQVARANFTVE